MRNLVSVQEIKNLEPIKDADKIEVATILGWKVVVVKDAFKVGDKCVYFEVDSYLPIEERFEFLRKSSYRIHPTLGEGFRIKTIKLRGQISQGLVFKLSDLGLNEDLEVGTDLTDLLHIRKWESIEVVSEFGKMKGDLPDGISKTDETRIQSIYDEIMPEFKGLKYYISTKIDGMSVTMYRKNGEFGVCSHQNEIVRDDEIKSPLWDFADKIKLKEKMEAKGYDNICIQGEYAGNSIHGNQLRLNGFRWFVFSIKDLSTGKRVSLDKMIEIVKDLDLEMVPVEEIGDDLETKYPTIESLLARANGTYESGRKKEGVVIRPVEPVYSSTLSAWLSFKVLNNDFLLKEE